jgi:hypothetical protein
MKTLSTFILFTALSLALAASYFSVEATAQAQASSRSGASVLEQQILAHEREGLDAFKTGELEKFAHLTAEEVIMVDASGAAGKSQILKNVVGFSLTDYTIEDVKFVPVARNTGLISYKLTEKGVTHGKDFSARVYVSSLWTQRGDQWLCLFSQETSAH